MTETAGWGVPDFLPPAVAMRMRQADAKEAIAAREAEAEQEAHREELRQRHLGLYAQQAAVRGELVSAVALATGQVPGRTVADILAAGAAAGDREDVIAMARLHRDGHGDPEPLHVFVDEPVIQQARSATGRKIATRARKFRDLLEARKALAAAEDAERRTRDHFALSRAVTLRSKEDDDSEVRTSASRRRGGRSGPSGRTARDDGLRFR